MQEKGVEGKNKIKERFNELAQQVTIDTSEFMSALLRKKEEKKSAEAAQAAAAEESKKDNKPQEAFIDGLKKA